VNQASNIVSIIFSFELATTDQLTEPLLNVILHYMKAGMFFSHPNKWYRDFDCIASSQFNQVQLNTEIWIEIIPHCSFFNDTQSIFRSLSEPLNSIL